MAGGKEVEREDRDEWKEWRRKEKWEFKKVRGNSISWCERKREREGGMEGERGREEEKGEIKKR